MVMPAAAVVMAVAAEAPAPSVPEWVPTSITMPLERGVPVRSMSFANAVAKYLTLISEYGEAVMLASATKMSRSVSFASSRFTRLAPVAVLPVSASTESLYFFWYSRTKPLKKVRLSNVVVVASAARSPYTWMPSLAWSVKVKLAGASAAARW